MCGIIALIETGALNPCTFSSISISAAHDSDVEPPGTAGGAGMTAMKDAYFLNTDSANVVKNDIVLDRKLIITGPNAAGKTTIIKTAIFNIILSQQIGYGAYSSTTIAPYHYLHCYLNIPDTSGRDSLFQAESRRCKEILDCIIANPTKRHFCIFDELYSGTNPYEAVASAYGYINYISGMRNVDFMLTTHYIQLCELFRGTSKPSTRMIKRIRKKPAAAGGNGGNDDCQHDGDDNVNVVIKEKEKTCTPPTPPGRRSKPERNVNIRNLHMETSVNNTFDYTYHYKIVSGISKIKGGIKVLFDLKYPDAIIRSTKSVLEL